MVEQNSLLIKTLIALQRMHLFSQAAGSSLRVSNLLSLMQLKVIVRVTERVSSLLGTRKQLVGIQIEVIQLLSQSRYGRLYPLATAGIYGFCAVHDIYGSR